MLNNVSIMGRFVDAPIIKHTPSGVPVLSFSLAVERNYKKEGEEKREVDFIDFEAWQKTAEFIERNFKKGQLIAVVGEITTNSYTDKEDKKRKDTYIKVQEAHFAGAAPQKDNEDSQ